MTAKNWNFFVSDIIQGIRIDWQRQTLKNEVMMGRREVIRFAHPRIYQNLIIRG